MNKWEFEPDEDDGEGPQYDLLGAEWAEYLEKGNE